MRYRISIHQDGPGRYRTQGSAVLAGVHNPMRAAAIDLLANGADPASKLAGVFETAAISPVTLAKLARAYIPPRSKSYQPDF